MILPSKHISQEQSLLGVGAVVLREIRYARTVSSLWESVRTRPPVGTFQRFILALDLLYMAGLLELREGLVDRVRR